MAALVSALGHPLRLKILAALAAGPNSATRLERQFGEVPGSVFYHLQVLQRVDVLEIARSRKVRGATERTFRLRPHASWGRLWESVPLAALSGFRSVAFRQFVDVVIEALKSGGLDGRADTTFMAMPITVDRQGLGEVSEAMQAALAVADRVAVESSGRIKGGDSDSSISAVVAAAAFEVSPSREPAE